VCGIVGILSFDGPAPHEPLWSRMTNHLHHRGPDEGALWADGPFFLGHRRLSIVDLATGGQPMATADGGLVVMLNGEIYNYVELRAELESEGYRFRTASDTEVLLHGYRKWGKDLPRHLRGMFAFALADRRRRELFVARDRFGEKPMFLFRSAGYVAFASELRPLILLPELVREIDVEALGGYLCLNYVPGSRTMMKSISRLPPASWALFKPGGCEETGIYWAPPTCERLAGPVDRHRALEEFRSRFDNAVRLCLRSDIPVGIFLSGGMDSSLVAESAMRQGKLSTAYVVDFEEETYSEYGAAKAVAMRLGLPLERAILTPDALRDFLQLVDHADDPLADSSSLPVWVLSRYAATKSKVVLGGDGGDEIFGGYLTYRATKLHESVACRLPMSLRRLLAFAGSHIPTSERKVSFSYKLRRFLRAADLAPGYVHLTWNGTWLPDEAARFVRSGKDRETVRSALFARADQLGLGGKHNLRQLQKADIGDYLPNDILAKVDRMSMAHGLETRAPFLDYELAEWALGMPDGLKVARGGETKTLLRAEARRVFGAETADRPKQGFSIPIHAWVRGPLSDVVRDLLSSSSVASMALIDPVAVEAAVRDHFSGRRSYGFELWGLCVLVAWYRARIAGDPASPPDLPLIRRKFAMASAA